MAENPDLSICIVNYNTREILRDCLHSIYGNTSGIGFEVIVVDNGSKDGSPEMVEREFPQVKLIKNDRNLYFTKANNQAIRASTGRYVLILNSDTVIPEGTLTKMVEFMDKHPDVGAASCMLLKPDGTIDLSCWKFYTLKDVLLTSWPLGKVLINNKMKYYDPTRLHKVDVVADAFMVVRRKAMNRVGLYDEQFFLYFTEDDICLRLRKAGWKVYYYPEVRIVHKLNISTKKMSFIQKKAITRKDMLTYFRKYHGFWKSLVLNIFLSSEIVLCLIVKKVRELIRQYFREQSQFKNH